MYNIKKKDKSILSKISILAKKYSLKRKKALSTIKGITVSMDDSKSFILHIS
jgi:hypothetical protein